MDFNEIKRAQKKKKTLFQYVNKKSNTFLEACCSVLPFQSSYKTDFVAEKSTFAPELSDWK